MNTKRSSSRNSSNRNYSKTTTVPSRIHYALKRRMSMVHLQRKKKESSTSILCFHQCEDVFRMLLIRGRETPERVPFQHHLICVFTLNKNQNQLVTMDHLSDPNGKDLPRNKERFCEILHSYYPFLHYLLWKYKIVSLVCGELRKRGNQ